MAVIRNGRMIWEGANADRAHEVFSVTKSFTSSILGLLIDDGVISLDTPAANYFPELAEKYGDVTLQHLVNMTSPWRAAGASLDYNTFRYTLGSGRTAVSASGCRVILFQRELRSL